MTRPGRLPISHALKHMPPGADLDTLRVWAEWRRQGMSVRKLARLSGHSRERINGILLGTAATRDRHLVLVDLAQVLGLRDEGEPWADGGGL